MHQSWIEFGTSFAHLDSDRPNYRILIKNNLIL